MKRFTVFIALLLMLVSAKSNAQNQRVLLFECFTNTGCGPCASQNPGLDNLINANDSRVASIKYHVSWPSSADPMYLHNTEDNNARRNAYSVSAVPHTVVDGMRFANQPAALTQNMINNWLNIESPVEMRLSYEIDQATNTITVHVMGRVLSAINGGVKLFVGVVERTIQYNSAPGPNGERTFHSVMKKLLPSSSGLVLGNVEVGDYFAYSFDWNYSNVYNVDQLDAIAWIQNQSTKEVCQACKSTDNMVPYFAIEGAVGNIGNLKTMYCNGEAEPSFVLNNYGSSPITTAEFDILVNDEVVKTVKWEGNLPSLKHTTVEIGSISFDVLENNTISVRIKKINETNDEYAQNDNTSSTFKGSPSNTDKQFLLNIRTDENPQETTWKVTNLWTGEVVAEGGPYTQANTLHNETLDITEEGCYNFTIYDAGGNGFNGNGVYGLRSGSTTLFSGRQFGESESNEFYFEKTDDVNEGIVANTTIFPNPSTGLVNIVVEGKQTVNVFNMVGQCVFEGVCDGSIQLDMKPFGTGIYAVKVGNEMHRIVVK